MTLRDRIIAESLKLFTLKGFSSTSMGDILKAAGTSKGGFYNHFASKEDLFFNVLDVARRHWRERNLADLESLARPLDKLATMLRNYRDRYLTDTDSLPGGCPFIMLSVELADQKPHLAAALEKGFSGLRRMIRRLLDEAAARGDIAPGTETTAVADLVFAGMLGASVMYGIDKSTTRLDNAINSLTAYLDRLQLSQP